MLKAIYDMLQSSLLYYKKFQKDIESIGFKVNLYDPCVATQMVNGNQHTVTWHVNDLKSSLIDSKVNDKFLLWLEEVYAYNKIGEVKAVCGHHHDSGFFNSRSSSSQHDPICQVNDRRFPSRAKQQDDYAIE
jgi:hypothetical protein